MAINVTCPECQNSFYVSKEFAGKSGRCPECNCVLTVPQENSFAAPHDNPYGNQTDFEEDHDHFDRLRPSRRRREEPEQNDRFDNDYEEEEFDRRRPQVRFDPAVRAARWKGVAAGLRNLMLATILCMLSIAVVFVFILVMGKEEDEAEELSNLALGVYVGSATFLAFAMLLWAWGRMRCASVPYVPARGTAYGSGILSALTALVGTLCLTGFIAGMIMLRNNPGGGAGLVILSICSMFFVLGGFVIAEIMGQVSQIRMAKALKYPPFAKAAKTQIFMACGLMLMGMFGLCILTGVASNDAKQKQQQQPQIGPVAQQPPPAPKGGGLFKKGKGKNNQPAVVVGPPAPNAPNGPNNGPNNNPPPPEFDPKDHPGLFLVMRITILCSTMIYGFVSILCYNLGRRAVDKEVHALTGDPHDQTGSENDHF